jgi:hypothetical protein
LTISPASFNFGTVNVGSTATAQSGLISAINGDITVTNDTLAGSGFILSGITYPMTISSGKSASFSVNFAPAIPGNSTGTLSFVSNASGSSSSTSLSGTGAGIVVSPATLSFGSVLDGTSSVPQSATLTALGSSITVTSANLQQNGGGGSAFSISGISFPLVLSAGASQTFTVTFAPAAGSPGTAGGTATFASSINSVTQSLGGTGAANVLISWNASTTPNVTYNVYRCTISSTACVQSSPENFSQIGSAVSALAYTDGSISSGQTYYYAITAVSTSGVEGVFSTVVSAAVP